MSSVQDVNPRVRGMGVSSGHGLQSLDQNITKGVKEVIDVSTGDPHTAGVSPVSFVRQVLAVCLYPQLLEEESFPLDVRQKAQMLIKACDGESVDRVQEELFLVLVLLEGSSCLLVLLRMEDWGSYADSSGFLHVRRSIAEFITERDAGRPAEAKNIFITSGVQKALLIILRLLSGGQGQVKTGVLTPLPSPHTLPTLLHEAGVMAAPYRLLEEHGWTVDLKELHRALKTSRGLCNTRAIYISNPGNPTGHVQDRKSIEEVIKFAAAEKLLLLVDEIYQDSVYAESCEFISYKKVLFDIDKDFRDTVEMVCFHSLSGTRLAECGLRAGYMETINMDQEVMHFVDTMLCTDISTPITGQLALDVMSNPPKPGDPSYDTYTQEMLFIRAALSRNAQRALKLLNELPGVSCQPARGGVYLYPRFHPPAVIREQAEMLGLEADVLYCQKLQEEEGLIVGSGQDCGTTGCHHLRLCVLAAPDSLEEVLSRLSSFHFRLIERQTENKEQRQEVTSQQVASS